MKFLLTEKVLNKTYLNQYWEKTSFLETNNLNKLLTEYGLTKNQAKILTTLIQTNNTLTVKQISQTSNIARESIYDILHKLQEKALIEKIITNPEKYRTIPLKRILKQFHEEKTNQIHNLEELTTQILLDNNHKPENHQINDKPQFVLIPKKKQLTNRLKQAIANSKKTIKSITIWKRYVKALAIYKTALKTSLSNGVKIQVLVYEKSTEDTETKEAMVFNDHPNTCIRYIDKPSEVIEIIIDDQKVFLMTNPKLGVVESPALWSNNQSLISALKKCFSSAWEETRK